MSFISSIMLFLFTKKVVFTLTYEKLSELRTKLLTTYGIRLMHLVEDTLLLDGSWLITSFYLDIGKSDMQPQNLRKFLATFFGSSSFKIVSVSIDFSMVVHNVFTSYNIFPYNPKSCKLGALMSIMEHPILDASFKETLSSLSLASTPLYDSAKSHNFCLIYKMVSALSKDSDVRFNQRNKVKYAMRDIFDFQTMLMSSSKLKDVSEYLTSYYKMSCVNHQSYKKDLIQNKMMSLHFNCDIPYFTFGPNPFLSLPSSSKKISIVMG